MFLWIKKGDNLETVSGTQQGLNVSLRCKISENHKNRLGCVFWNLGKVSEYTVCWSMDNYLLHSEQHLIFTNDYII